MLEQLQAELNAEGAGLLLPEDTANPEWLPATPSPDQPKAASSDGLLPEMPTLTIDGRQYIGYLELPTLGISLPILSDWSYAKLRVAPCRYWGSVYDGSMVLLGHNYLDHFGRLKSLELGDPIQFIDADGNIYRYEVVQQETLEKTDVDAMLDSPYDLDPFHLRPRRRTPHRRPRKGQCPLTPDCAPMARRGVGGHVTWPGFYRRSATGLAARGSGVAPC